MSTNCTRWWWEQDAPLRFEGSWLASCAADMPASVRELHIELESLERKKEQVDAIAKQMAEKWYFTRQDGVTLFPDVSGKAVKIDRWSGSSTWNGQTWQRDESAPGRIDYYIATVAFRPQRVVEKLGGHVKPEIVEAAEQGIRHTSRWLALLAGVQDDDDDDGQAPFLHHGGWDGEENDSEWDEEEDEQDYEETDDDESGDYGTH